MIVEIMSDLVPLQLLGKLLTKFAILRDKILVCKATKRQKAIAFRLILN